MSKISLFLSLTNPPRRLQIEIEQDATANQLFEVASSATSIPQEKMKLIFRGRIISNKEVPINDFQLEEGCVIHCMGKSVAVVGQENALSSLSSATTTSPMIPSSATRIATVQPVLTVNNEARNTATATAAPTLSSEISLSASILRMKTNHSAEDYITGLTTLSKILTNVIEKPMEEKYRRMKKANAAFQKRLGRMEGAQGAMFAVGFEDEGEEYVLKPSAEAWPKVLQSKKTVDEAIAEHQRAQSHAAQIQQQQQQQQQQPFSLPNFVSGMGMPPNIDPSMMEGMAEMFNNPETLQALLTNPMLHQLMQNDPRFANNPMARESLRQLQSNPQMLEQASRMMSDPQTRNHMMNLVRQSGGMAWNQNANVTGRSNSINGTTGNNNGNSQNSGNNPTSNAGEREMTEEEMIQEAIRRSMEER
jgi:ubiquilin